MVPELLHHIERLQRELASLDSQGSAVTGAVARIADGLRSRAVPEAVGKPAGRPDR